MIYLDYSATTPVNDEVIETYVKTCREYVGNPNSLHGLGVKSRMLIEAATNQIASILNVRPSEIIYTSGASEANNAAIKGVCFKYKNRGKHIISTELEHSSVYEVLSYLKTLGFEVDFVRLDENGVVDLDDLARLMCDDTILVSIASVNSEVGVRQPIEEISKIVKKYPKAYFHSDVTQSIGKEKIDLSVVDLASFSAQKFYGMKGVGCLIKKENIAIEPLIHGGKSTTIYRSGTPATPLITSLAKALRLVYVDFTQRYDHVVELNKYLKDELGKLDVIVNSNDRCLPHILNISLKGIKSETMLHALEEEEIYVSTQTACSTGNYSRALYAMYHDIDRAGRSLRISLSYLTSMEDCEVFIRTFKRCLEKLNIK